MSDKVVEGFLFASEKDSELAEAELKKIQYLNQNMNYSNIEKVHRLYDKMLDEKQFKTPIGWTYLLNLRELLVNAGKREQDLRPIPMYSLFTYEDTIKEETIKPRVKPSKKKQKEEKNGLMISVCINVILVICVIAMFYIAMKSETPNIINYRQSIVNEYSSWEQDLTEREKAVRQKERELNIQWNN